MRLVDIMEPAIVALAQDIRRHLTREQWCDVLHAAERIVLGDSPTGVDARRRRYLELTGAVFGTPDDIEELDAALLQLGQGEGR